MTLSEIENTLRELTVRHVGLDAELLRTLLTSAGWEDKHIKEALSMFTGFDRKKSTPMQAPAVPIVSSRITGTESAEKTPSEEKQLAPLYPQDTIQEKELPAVSVTQADATSTIVDQAHPSAHLENSNTTMQDGQVQRAVEEPLSPGINNEKEVIATPVEDVKKDTIATTQEYLVQPSDKKQGNLTTLETSPFEDTHTVIVEEPQSLIPHTEVLIHKEREKETEIPGNLPLLPFESSPHIWSFSRYKDVFHADTIPRESIQVITTMPQQEVITLQKHVEKEAQGSPSLNTTDVEEISVEKVPLTKSDESLVFLAGVMLLVIILILGYMYSNGRL